MKRSHGGSFPRLTVAIVGDDHHFGVDTPPPPEFYTPARQPPTYGLMTVVVQTAEESRALMPAVRSVIRKISPDVPLYNVRTLDSVLSESMAGARFRTVLLALFAALAVLLAAVGTYGVIALVVSQRVREMAVRLALGATMRDIVRFVVVGGMRPVLVGTAAGLAAGAVEGRIISNLLFRVAPGDPPTFAVAAIVVVVSGLVATWFPARRACRVDAAEVLRQ
jgi:ABC-type antimicrobial peptide transport system permease subunit